MIVRIMSRGSSFKGLSTYLTHDARANTDERVAWTHTHNLANDHVPSAVNEMFETARNAELLKQEAGVRAGGRATENPVKHISLNWAPDDQPARGHMIVTAEDYLHKMGWGEHQAIFVAHDDKAHKHVHVMLNIIHPETGLRLDDGFEQRRTQAWALEYEREQGRIHCEQRLSHPQEREKSPPRNIWTAFQENERKFEKSEKLLRDNSSGELKSNRNEEWQILKENQRAEREAFFATGKSEFSDLRSSIYREIREEFRERWADFYEARKNGVDADSLPALKAQLIGEQKASLDARREQACGQLRETRDEYYRGLLGQQREERAELRWRQAAGLDNAPFFNQLADSKEASRETASGFREAAREATASRREAEPATREVETADGDAPGARPGRDTGTRVVRNARAGVASFFDSLFFDLTTLGSSNNPKPRPDSEIFQAAADETQKRQQHELEGRDAEGRAHQRVLYGE